MQSVIGIGDEHESCDYVLSKKTSLLDLIKGAGFVILLFVPGILCEYFYPNIWVSVLPQMIPIVFFVFVFLWIIGDMR